MVTLDRYLRDLPPNEGGLMTNNNEPIGCGRRNETLIVFKEQHFIQSSIQSNYSINVLSGDLYQGDPDLYWYFNLVADL